MRGIEGVRAERQLSVGGEDEVRKTSRKEIVELSLKGCTEIGGFGEEVNVPEGKNSGQNEQAEQEWGTVFLDSYLISYPSSSVKVGNDNTCLERLL